MNQTSKKRQRGMTIVELLIACIVLAVGMLGSLTLIYMSILDNTRNRLDTTGTMLAQQVIEQINALPANNVSVTTLPITDCQNNALSIGVTGGAPPAGAGATLVADTTSPSFGRIDWTQPAPAAPYGYRFISCDGFAYDVRWNIQILNPSTKLIVASARRMRTANGNARFFAPPVSLRTISGP